MDIIEEKKATAIERTGYFLRSSVAVPIEARKESGAIVTESLTKTKLKLPALRVSSENPRSDEITQFKVTNKA